MLSLYFLVFEVLARRRLNLVLFIHFDHPPLSAMLILNNMCLNLFSIKQQQPPIRSFTPATFYILPLFAASFVCPLTLFAVAVSDNVIAV